MYVFIDESGDTGTKFGQGSSERMIIALVFFDDEAQMQLAEERINALRGELRQSPRFEFHFKDNSDDVRRKFFEAIAPLSFRYVAVVVDKKRWATAYENHATFYKQVCVSLLEAASPFLQNAVVKLDKSGATAFRQELTREIKRQINTPDAEKSERSPVIKSVAMEPSHTSNLVQMADMVCGAIARSYRLDKSKQQAFVKIIAHHQATVRELPS